MAESELVKNKPMARHFGIASAIGIMCVGMFWLIDKYVWSHSPYLINSDELARMTTWGINTIKVKLAGMALMFLSSLGIAVHYRRHWTIAVTCAISAAVIFQCTLVAIYIMRHGHESYLKYHNVVGTALMTLAIPYSVAFFVSIKSFIEWSRQWKLLQSAKNQNRALAERAELEAQPRDGH